MDPVSLLVLGLELQRFPASDSSAASLGDSLEVIEAGGLSLAPYQGPALQPVIGWRSRKLMLSLAPGLAGGSSVATSSDGRQARVSTLQWREQARAWYLAGPVVLGLDVAVSGGSATTGGTTVATAPLGLELGPTAGVRVPLGHQLELAGRARWPVWLAGDQLSQGLSGALMLSWQPSSKIVAQPGS
ncbi:MAG: hypothetical protein GXP62_06605 [Oligoflexia bacterium]|nr:hypothetical protein [Oligoflexia bacterium]